MKTIIDNKLVEKVILPEGVSANVKDFSITVKGPAGELTREFLLPSINLSIENNEIKLLSKNTTRKILRMMNTFAAHINNMAQGVTKKFEYQVKICSGHFPMTVKKEEKEVVITNFLGEKIPRRSKIVEGVDLEIKGDLIIIKSVNIEAAGQTATNLEHATFIKKRDRRVFQDGCYIISKPKDKK
jgi:large subunit ribosomal protein L6|tara:strand:+ start:341 stop:895 length:555 start_codon:yes stop_codon:yes gene_type:complete